MAQTPELMNTRQVTGYLGINEKKVYALVKTRKIPCTRVTGKWTFPRRLIDAWIEQSAARPIATRPSAWAGRIAVLHQGRLAQIGAREDVFYRPASEIVAEIVGIENRFARRGGGQRGRGIYPSHQSE
jgi:excisionase family DNA binding protein